MVKYSDLGQAEILCGDRNLCARPYQHTGDHEAFSGNVWANECKFCFILGKLGPCDAHAK